MFVRCLCLELSTLIADGFDLASEVGFLDRRRARPVIWPA